MIKGALFFYLMFGLPASAKTVLTCTGDLPLSVTQNRRKPAVETAGLLRVDDPAPEAAIRIGPRGQPMAVVRVFDLKILEQAPQKSKVRAHWTHYQNGFSVEFKSFNSRNTWKASCSKKSDRFELAPDPDQAFLFKPKK